MAVASHHRPAHMRSRGGSRRRPRGSGRRARRSGGGVLSSPEMQNLLLLVALGLAAAVAAAVSQAAPTGLEVVDELWVGGFVAVVGYFAGYARRWTWFVPAGAGALVAADDTALLCAGAAILLGLLSVLTDLRSRPLAAVVAGFGMVPLLHTDQVGFHGATALLAAAAVTPVIASGYRLASRPTRRRIRQAAGWSAFAVVVMLAGGAVGIMTVAGDLTKGARLIDQGVLAARDADDNEAAIRLGEASRHLRSAEVTLTSWFVQPAHAIPFVGPNIRAVSEMARESAEATDVSSAAATAADLEELRFEGGRLDPRRIEAMINPLENVATSAGDAQEAVGDARSPWLVSPVQERMDQLEQELSENLPDLETALEAVRIAGPLMGSEEDRRYLVLFTTPTEARGRTGFPGNYAELTFEDGRLDMPRFGRISELEPGPNEDPDRQISGPEDFLARYSRFEPDVTWRNIVMSPDFPTIADVAMELYPQSGGSEVDGVLSVDPTGLAALMHFTGDVELAELEDPLTADNVEQFLHYDQYVHYADQTAERVDFLGDVAEQVFQQLTEASLPNPTEVVDVLGPAVDGNHIQFTTRVDEEAAYFEEIGADGAMPPVAGDFLAMTTSNAGGSKIDVFLNRRLDYDVTWDPTTGDFDATVTATLHNAAPAEGLPDYLIGNNIELPWGTNRSFVSIYTPWPLAGARLNGQPLDLHPEREVGRLVYSTFVDIPSGGEAVVELDFSGTWGADFYFLKMMPAPLVSDEQARVAVTVPGDLPLYLDGEEGWSVDGRTASWEGPLNEPRDFALGFRPADGAGPGEAP